MASQDRYDAHERCLQELARERGAGDVRMNAALDHIEQNEEELEVALDHIEALLLSTPKVVDCELAEAFLIRHQRIDEPAHDSE